MRNYLLRLGWSHGDDEIISTEQAIEWFGLDHVGRSPARFDFVKLNNLNGHYIRSTPDADLLQAALPFIAKRIGRAPDTIEQATVMAILPAVKERAKDLNELAEGVLFLRSEEHTSELQSLVRISHAVFGLQQTTKQNLRCHVHMT